MTSVQTRRLSTIRSPPTSTRRGAKASGRDPYLAGRDPAPADLRVSEAVVLARNRANFDAHDAGVRGLAGVASCGSGKL